MTKDDILRMARKADFCVNDYGEISTRNLYGIIQGELDSFAALVAAAVVAKEREACAKLCDDLDAQEWSDVGEYTSGYGNEIRKRGIQ